MSLPIHWVASLAGSRVGDRITVEGDEAHHAVAVRRLRVGEALVLTDGAGTRVTGTVAETGSPSSRPSRRATAASSPSRC
jgi:16S rRNA (uracil1498-N3)-methyltransferase